MTKEDFYDFAKLMYNDSKILFDKKSYHNSVYLGAFVLEGYIKYLILKNNPDGDFYGHINESNFMRKVARLLDIALPEDGISILKQGYDFYPENLFSSKYDINYRYEVDINKWNNQEFAQKIQNEIRPIKILLLGLDGVTHDNN